MVDIHLGPANLPQGFHWAPIIALAPHLIWAVVVAFALFWVGREGVRGLAGRINKIGAGGFGIEFQNALETAAEAHQKQISSIDLGKASRRLSSQQALLRGARLLWIDDRPDNNRNEIKLFEDGGARVDTRVTSAEAEAAILQVTFDLIVSDIDREGSATEGLRFADELFQHRNSPPLIFYVGRASKPVPTSAFGIADRPDELVHLVLDALGRSRS
jgi:CheY-like chemotaxis protein